MNEERIIAYIQGKLLPKEREDFEQQLEIDEQLSKEFFAEKVVFDAVRSSRRKRDAALLNSIEKDSSRKENPIRRIKPHNLIWWAAACILIAIGLFSYSGLFEPTPSFQETVAAYDQPLENDFYILTRSTSSQSKYYDAFVSYDLENYKEASIKLRTLYKEEKKSQILAYLLSSLVQEGDYDEVINLFEKNNISASMTENDDVSWYAALSYLHENRNKTAKELLSNFKPSSTYFDKAQEILTKIDQN
ncbi:MAG: hypothetical protein WBG46_12305 [Nonlabens sp.]